MITIIVSLIFGLSGFIAGILVGRKNKAKIEKVVSAARLYGARRGQAKALKIKEDIHDS